jgi:hypothetical protein
LHNKEKVREYIRRGEEVAEGFYQDYLKEEPSPLLLRLRELKRQRDAGQVAGT